MVKSKPVTINDYQAKQDQLDRCRKLVDNLLDQGDHNTRKMWGRIYKGPGLYEAQPFGMYPEGVRNEIDSAIYSAARFISRHRENLRETKDMGDWREAKIDKMRERVYVQLNEWRPNNYFRVQHTGHSRDIKLIINDKDRYKMLHYPVGLYRHRGAVPWVVTDRFVLAWENESGKPVGDILNEDKAYRCKYLDIDGSFRLGYLAMQSGFYGCSARDFDAKKAAKMKAVQHVKTQIIGDR